MYTGLVSGFTIFLCYVVSVVPKGSPGLYKLYKRPSHLMIIEYLDKRIDRLGLICLAGGAGLIYCADKSMF